MEPSDAIAFLRQYNAWRRGYQGIKQPQPYEISQAIDALCDHAEWMGREIAVWNETAIVWWYEYQDLKAKLKP